MKFETINKDKLKYLISVLVIVLVISTIFILKTSRAKFEYTKSYSLASGTINYTLPDMEVISMNVQTAEGSSTYQEVDKDPGSEYVINSSKSYCGTYNTTAGGIDKDSNIAIESVNGKVAMSNLKKGTRCLLYFDYNPTEAGKMLNKLRSLNSNIPASSGVRTDFSTKISSGSYTYTATDDLGTSYYFAGAVNTNWVKIGSTYWRIIRINGNGSVRLIYSGTDSPTSSQAAVMTGTQTQYTTSAFNSSYDDNAYVGYMYGSTSATTYADTHKNTNPSTIKGKVDEWYNSNKSAVENLIDINVGFCGDRSVSSSDGGTPGTSAGTGGSAAYYGARYRLRTNKSPDITCNKSNSTLYNNDLYTKTGASRGNKALANPVGLITADEVALAGGVYDINNTGYYLYTNQRYWTMSPLFATNASVFIVNSSGWLDSYGVSNTGGVRPVINLKSSLTWSGKGTWDEPFQPSL